MHGYLHACMLSRAAGLPWHYATHWACIGESRLATCQASARDVEVSSWQITLSIDLCILSTRLFGCNNGSPTGISRFIPRFADLAAVLYDLTKAEPSTWKDVCTTNWKKLTDCLVNCTQCYHPDFSNPFHVYCDASCLGVGVVLLQQHQSAMQPVAFCARRIQPAELNYTTTCVQSRNFSLSCIASSNGGATWRANVLHSF